MRLDARVEHAHDAAIEKRIRQQYIALTPLERFPVGWNHLTDRKSLKVKTLEHVLVEKVVQLFRDTP
jgi:hypothetical protein